MAESSIRYRSWYKEFEIGEFAIFWLILETVLDHDRMIADEACLDARLRELREWMEQHPDSPPIPHLEKRVSGRNEDWRRGQGFCSPTCSLFCMM